jgi:hypothetical protein
LTTRGSSALKSAYLGGLQLEESVQRKRCDQTPKLTIYLFVTKLVLENLHERMEEISSRRMDWLRGYVKRELHRQGMTHYASRLVDDDKFPFGIMMDDFHWFSSDGGLMPVYDIPRPEAQSHMK